MSPGHLVVLGIAAQKECDVLIHQHDALVFGCRNAFKKILCRFLCNKAEPRQPGALVRMGLVPFAPHTVAIGLADRFPPAAVVTAASEGSQVRQTAAGNVAVSRGRVGESQDP